MQVYLVRHGQSFQNTEDMRRAISLEDFRQLVFDSEHSALTPTGIEQAAQAAERLLPLQITHLYASPYLRAQQTAAIIAERLGLPVTTVEGLREINAIMPPVLRRNRLRSLRSLYIRGYLHQVWPRQPESGETWWQARRRFATLWHDLNQEWRPSSRPALVAHRGLIWLALRQLENLPGWRVARRELENGGISLVEQV
ncbi:MAG TPA: histidine phosphatase family protein [Herpetosiphonaceae bacterium]|nr:histidine phosphatase family protein [Herpetosiphonaceae bacterium]